MSLFADIILPIPLPKPFTYAVPKLYEEQLAIGQRVVVPFGKMKFYTGIVYRIHHQVPLGYEVKVIDSILDVIPSITQHQIQLWEWISSYYLCPLGLIMKAAIPSVLLIESETVLAKDTSLTIEWETLTDDELLLLEALEKGPLSFADVMAITGKKAVMKSIGGLLAHKYVYLQQLLKENYRPKKVKQIRLRPELLEKNQMEAVFKRLQKAPKQQELLLGYLSQYPKANWTDTVALQKKWGSSASITKQLVDKAIMERREITVDRLRSEIPQQKETIKLTTAQQKANASLAASFEKHTVVLLEGITGSGKTAIYMDHIKDVLEAGKQVLYLLPEISLTTQIVGRLKAQFPDRLAVYHSKFNPQERAEIWRHVLHQERKAQLLVGARSAVWLPFQNLGLIIVDEEHETSYKQFDPAPRYHARDTAIVLAKHFEAKVLLGSATPSLESFHQVALSKYGHVALKERYGAAQLPHIELVDMKEAHRKKQMQQGVFSDALVAAIESAIANEQQVILFHNRRGYATLMECRSCGYIPQCTQCDVSLTYHEFNPKMQCHYCGYHIAKPTACVACGTPHLTDKGTGTQQIETTLKYLFPDIQVGRMDWDSTRGKNDFDTLLDSFSAGNIQVLVGTQMVVKGLDFKNVQLVGVINADQLIHQPDFRAHERSVQMLSQVAGRAGRSHSKGRVLIQTYNPNQQLLQHVQKNTLPIFYATELHERKRLEYPPFGRLIRITFKHRNRDLVEKAALWFANVVKQSYPKTVLGPTAPLIARIQNNYLQQLLFKIPTPTDRIQLKLLLVKTQKSFEAIALFRAVRINLDVDPY
ncbi:MAG: replication restart helicase PriA [Flavobacteriaceae bacterium]